MFAPASVVLEAATAGSGSGSLASSPAGIECGGVCSASFGGGATVTLTETPGSGSVFSGWRVEPGADVRSGCTGTEATCTLVMGAPGPVRVTGTFEASNSPFLGVKLAGSGSGSVLSGEHPAGIECPTRCSAGFTAGAEVSLQETPRAGSSFAGWSVQPAGAVVSGCAGTEAVCEVRVSEVTSVSATFTPTPVLLEVARGGAGSGAVASSPAGIQCGSVCSASFGELGTVALSETPAAGSVFAGWKVEPGADVVSGCAGTQASCAVVMSGPGPVRVSAVFEVAPKVSLSVKVVGGLLGSVVSGETPAGIECPSACSASFSAGQEVELKATPKAGATFMGWSVEPGAAVLSGCAGTQPVCVLRLSEATTVSATFAVTVPVQVTKLGSGTGSVSSAPAGIECGGSCEAPFVELKPLTLSRDPRRGFAF